MIEDNALTLLREFHSLKNKSSADKGTVWGQNEIIQSEFGLLSVLRYIRLSKSSNKGDIKTIVAERGS